MKIKIYFITILNFVVYIISNIGKYYIHLLYFDEKLTKNKKKPSHNTTKTDRVYKSPKSIKNKVN